MKILFINVSNKWQGRVYREYPYGVGLLATIADNAGENVKIFDMALEENDLENVVNSYQPDVIGLSFFSPSLNVAIDVIKELKRYYNGHLIAGGIHSTLYPKEVLALGVDMVLKGEGEYIILPVLEYLRKVSPRKYSDKMIEQIPSISYVDIDGKVAENEMISESVELDKLPILNRDLFDMSLYHNHTILTSRGCPYRCHFCCSWAPGGKRNRVMSKERIFEELDYLVNRFGEVEIFWGDEIFFLNKKERLSFLYELKKRAYPIKFTAQLRADLVDEDLAKALYEAGCTKLCIGAESGSQEILDKCNKKLSTEAIKKAIKIANNVGLITKTWWIIGLPSSTIESQLESLDIIKETRPNEVALHNFVPLPGSEFWENSATYGIELPDKENYEKLTFYCQSESAKFKYMSFEEMMDVLKIYTKELLDMGYIETDRATKEDNYIFTSPYQKTTFNI